MHRPTAFTRLCGVRTAFTRLIALAVLALGMGAMVPAGMGHGAFASEDPPTRQATGTERVRDSLDRLSLSFVPNVGQVDGDVRYYAHGENSVFAFAPGRVVLSFSRGAQGEALHLVPVDARPDVAPEARHRGRAQINYLLGSKRLTNLPTYGEVVYPDVWPGIDLAFRGKGGALKYELRIAPGADPSRIHLAYEGADDMSISAGGNLLVDTPLGSLRDSQPRTFQRVGGKRVSVDSRYVLDERAGTFGFEVGASHDPTRPLVIDPGPDYSTFLGGTQNEIGIDIAVGADGSAYVTGGTRSSADFPITPGAFDTSYNNAPGDPFRDIYVAKLNPSGSSLVYATYIGGNQAESGLGITVDAGGHAFVSGGTGSPDFPTTPGAFDETHNGFEDVYVVKLSPDGSSLVYSTVIGGASVEGEFAPGIALDNSGNAFITGGTGSPEFPTTLGAFDRTHTGTGQLDAFVAKVNPTGSALMYSTLLGGGKHDTGFRIAVAAGVAHVTGDTQSTAFPTTAGAFDRTHNGGQDAFAAKVHAGGRSLLYATYLGGTAFEYARGIDLGADGSAYLTGGTSSPEFPTTPGAFDRSYNRFEDGYVAKLNSAGTALSYSTFVGGGAKDRSNSVAVDNAGNAYITGETASADFPTTPGAFDASFNGEQDAFLVKLNAGSSGPLAASTFLGGNAVDFGRGIAPGPGGSVIVTGRAGSSNFPTTGGAFDTSQNGGLDAFVTKFRL